MLGGHFEEDAFSSELIVEAVYCVEIGDELHCYFFAFRWLDLSLGYGYE